MGGGRDEAQTLRSILFRGLGVLYKENIHSSMVGGKTPWQPVSNVRSANINV